MCYFSCRAPVVWLYCTNTSSYCCHTPQTSSPALSSSSKRAPGTAAYERSCKVTDHPLAAVAASHHSPAVSATALKSYQHFLVGLVLKHQCLKPSAESLISSPKLLAKSQSTSIFYTRSLLSSGRPAALSVLASASCRGAQAG